MCCKLYKGLWLKCFHATLDIRRNDTRKIRLVIRLPLWTARWLPQQQTLSSALPSGSSKMISDTAPLKILICSQKRPFKHKTLKTPQDLTHQKCWMKSTVYPVWCVSLPAEAADMFSTSLLNSFCCCSIILVCYHCSAQRGPQFFLIRKSSLYFVSIQSSKLHVGKEVVSLRDKEIEFFHYAFGGVRDHRDLLSHSFCNSV